MKLMLCTMPQRIPRSNDSFDTFIKTTATALVQGTPTTAQRLGLTPEQTTAWLDFKTAWQEVYTKHTNPLLRTPAVREEKEWVREAFMDFASPVLLAMSVHSALTEDDRLTFRLPKRDRTMTKRGRIDDVPAATIEPLTGGSIKVRVRHSAVHGRSSLHPLADHLEMRYMLVPPQGMGEDGLLWPEPPATAAQCPLVCISTRALFTLRVGEVKAGMRLYAFFRWVNATNDAHSGSWSNARYTVIV
jgi:hypothetical protein